MKYAVVIEQGPGSFGAHVPDLPGCVAAGTTREEVIQLIQEAIEFHIDGLKVNGETDSNAGNNSAITEVKVLDGYVQYNVIEDFFSVECGPCYDAALKLDATLSEFD